MNNRKTFLGSLRTIKSLCENFGDYYVSWKDAEPSMWNKLPKELTLHQHPHCLKIKKEPDNTLQCSKFDNHLKPISQIPVKRTCPFGFMEWMIPVFYQETYIGCLYLGPENDESIKKKVAGIKTKKTHLLIDIIKPWLPVIAEQRYFLSSKETRNDLVIQTVNSYIEQNTHRQITLAELATKVHLSPSRLRHRYVEKTGERISDKIKKSRLAAIATTLLEFPNLSISEISHKMGWSDTAYLNNCFKKAYGHSPSKWRNLKLKSEA
jgi:YesN/AraC family two-component response regulator